jgi:hypothetical protein
MSEDARIGKVIATDALIGTFDILGATAIYAIEEKHNVEKITMFLVESISHAIDAPKDELMRLAKESSINDDYIKELIKRTSSYVYADTIVFMCDVSELDGIKKQIAYEYFMPLSTEITRYMFMDGIPVRGCLSCGVVAIYKNECSMVVSGKAYVEAIRNADNLEFSGTVLTDGFNEAYNKNMKNLGAPMSCARQLPCAVKDKINNKVAFKKMWCLDWLDDTDFLKDGSDIRQLIVDSFAGHGKDVYGFVIGKIDNTETIIRMFIAHRKAGKQCRCAVK